MFDLIEQTINTLKSRIRKNLDTIHTNQTFIKQLLSTTHTVKSTRKYDEYSDANKALLLENNDYINVQLTLVNFLEKYKGTAVLEESIPIIDIYSITDESEVLELTVKGIIHFNENHPRFNDNGFIDKMITHFESCEEYEKCFELSEMKSKQV